MPERPPFEPTLLTNQELRAIDASGAAGLQIVQREYGSGYPAFKGGCHPLAYHGVYHSENVGDTAEKIAEAYGLDRQWRRIARAAGYRHDTIQLKPRGVMERESAEDAERDLRSREVPAWVGRVVNLAIRGTEVAMKGTAPAGQMATKLEYPSDKARKVAYSVAGADVAIYLPIGAVASHLWYAETLDVSGHKVPSLDKLLDYQRGQVKFMENHKYPDPVVERIMGGRQRRPAIAYATNLLRQLEQGEITSWGQLLRQDMQYARQHGYRGPDIALPKSAR